MATINRSYNIEQRNRVDVRKKKREDATLEDERQLRNEALC